MNYSKIDLYIRIIIDIIISFSTLIIVFIFTFIGFIFLSEVNLYEAVDLFSNNVKLFLYVFLLYPSLNSLLFYYSGIYGKIRNFHIEKKLAFISVLILISNAAFFLLIYLLFKDRLSLSTITLFSLFKFFLDLLIYNFSRIWSDLIINLANSYKSTLSIRKKNDYRDKKNIVLVIGGGGYIGSSLTKQLLRAGYQVRVLDLLLYGESTIKEFKNSSNFQLIKGDFRNIDDICIALKNVNVVYHLGGLVGDPACAFDPDLTIDINVKATKIIAELSKIYGISKFIFASSCSVYGFNDNKVDEASTESPLSLYAKTKLKSEKDIFKLADEHFCISSLRLSTIYGFSNRVRFDLVVNLLSFHAQNKREIKVINGKQWRPFIHVNDAAGVFFEFLFAENHKINKEIFNVGFEDENYMIEDIAKIIREIDPKVNIIYENTGVDFRNYKVSFKKLHNLINYKKKWTLKKGILNIIKEIKEKKISSIGPDYNNFEFIKKNRSMFNIRIDN